ncbi:hypothetical protein GALMADRAFT_272579 [Galerina marginata CBS 339.88]|uniref:FAD dependent oxidoreductase domain-containing protein n=1 Tax=Galerina marginata (strain CBS 339.88) TaxID=685588 RepID=A0A067SKV2_GALM3|nr:hypothetical protein GALMADRAFT_272579 [Galerina marginata CBS 339.88]
MDKPSGSSSDNESNKGKKNIVVLGAGVAGLTTALKIQEKGIYQVEIIAEVLPSDPKTIKYTSHWAGAHYVSSSATGTQQAEIDHKTFLEMWSLSEPGGSGGAEECFLRLPQTEYYHTDQPKPNPLERMPGFQEVAKKDLFPGARCGFSFETITIDVPVYLNYLASQFLQKGGSIIRGQVQHIDQVLEAGSSPFFPEKENAGSSNKITGRPTSTPDAVIVCAGLGSRFLGGVEDALVYPSRGQTVILRAPWIRFGRSFETGDSWTYIIPRRSGEVVIGGTQGIDDWYPKARPETTRELLKRAIALCPELAPPEMRIKYPNDPPQVEDVLPIVVEEACGLRPMRKGGPRIELEYLKSLTGEDDVPVVYNYGHGTQGYIQSIGSADHVLKLLEEGLQRYF